MIDESVVEIAGYVVIGFDGFNRNRADRCLSGFIKGADASIVKGPGASIVFLR